MQATMKTSDATRLVARPLILRPETVKSAEASEQESRRMAAASGSPFHEVTLNTAPVPDPNKPPPANPKPFPDDDSDGPDSAPGSDPAPKPQPR